MMLIVAEPPPAYAERPRLVVDASVLAAGVFAEAGRDAALSWMRGRTLCAPHLVDCEIASVALGKIQRGQIHAELAIQLLQAFSALPVERHAIDAEEVLALALRTRLTAYDAAYLWLAVQLRVPLATFDAKLGAAARDVLGERA